MGSYKHCFINKNYRIINSRTYNNNYIGEFSYYLHEDYIYIIMINIDTNYRNKGYGSKIINFIKNKYKKTYKYIKLEPLSLYNLDKLYKFYKSHGFIIDNENYAYYYF